MYCHAALICLGANYTLAQDAHARIDIFYKDFSPKKKAYVNIATSLFLLIPFAVLFLIYALSYVSHSWMHLESSPESGGLPALFLLKSLLLLMPILLLVQAFSLLIQNINHIVFIRGSQGSQGSQANGSSQALAKAQGVPKARPQ